jgi:uncharacterized protein YecE (DUF72 family)
MAMSNANVDDASRITHGRGRDRTIAVRWHGSQRPGEDRHRASWFAANVDQWMVERQIARVAADPARVSGAGEPGGWRGFFYIRLHGSPDVYYSSYDEDALGSLASRTELLAAEAPIWCIFDNTAAGAAMDNALALQEDLQTID